MTRYPVRLPVEPYAPEIDLPECVRRLSPPDGLPRAGPLMADSEGSHAPRTPFQVWKAFGWSMKGLRDCWQLESSFRLEVYLCLVLGPLAVWLGQTGVERAILLGSLVLVLVVEVLNSAVEAVVDRWGAEHHTLAGRAKDMGSAAVFLADVYVVVCWGFIVLPRYL